jgi:hypothetical protein
VCDDVRTEILSKETIVGVYNSGLVVPQLPWAALLCLWLTVIWSGDGALPIAVRVLNPGNKEVGSQQGDGIATFQGLESTLTFKHILITIEMEGVYTFQWKVGTNEWQTVKQLPAYIFRDNPTTS